MEHLVNTYCYDFVPRIISKTNLVLIAPVSGHASLPCRGCSPAFWLLLINRMDHCPGFHCPSQAWNMRTSQR